MSFHIGQEVVCVDLTSTLILKGVNLANPDLVLGKHYTVTGINLVHDYDPDQLPCIEVDGEGPYCGPIVFVL